MKNLKFVVKVNHDDSSAPEYVRRIDRIPIDLTCNRKRALVMGRFTAEDVVKSLHTSRRGYGLVSVTVCPTSGLEEKAKHLSSSVIECHRESQSRRT